jgi:hypothetical protein
MEVSNKLVQAEHQNKNAKTTPVGKTISFFFVSSPSLLLRKQMMNYQEFDWLSIYDREEWQLPRSVLDRTIAPTLQSENIINPLYSKPLEAAEGTWLSSSVTVGCTNRRFDRLADLEEKLLKERCSEEEKNRQLQFLGRKVSQYSKSRRTILDLDNFKTVKVIGKGVFDKVSLFVLCIVLMRKMADLFLLGLISSSLVFGVIDKIYAMRTLRESEMLKKAEGTYSHTF